MFPCNHGMVSFFPSGGISRRCVPETSPCHVQAKQDGELDPLRVARFGPGAFAAESRPQQTRHRPFATHRLSSKPARHVGSLGWLFSMQNPRSPARRPIQSKEVEPSAHVSPRGIGVPHQDPPVALALWRLSSASSSPRRAEVGSTTIHDRLLRATKLRFLACLF
jgi:hypothetical protein